MALLIAAAALLPACGEAESSPAGASGVSQSFTVVPASPGLTAGPEKSHSPDPATPSSASSFGAASDQSAPDGSGEAVVPSPTEGQAGAPLQRRPPSKAEESSAEDIATIGRMVDAYWAAFNAYDADLAVSMLERGYRADEEELIRRDIGRMKLFRVKLDVSEEKPLALNDQGDYETYLRIATPVDSRKVKMVFRRIEGQWRIVFSDEIE